MAAYIGINRPLNLPSGLGAVGLGGRLETFLLGFSVFFIAIEASFALGFSFSADSDFSFGLSVDSSLSFTTGFDFSLSNIRIIALDQIYIWIIIVFAKKSFSSKSWSKQIKSFLSLDIWKQNEEHANLPPALNSSIFLLFECKCYNFGKPMAQKR